MFRKTGNKCSKYEFKMAGARLLLPKKPFPDCAENGFFVFCNLIVSLETVDDSDEVFSF